METNEALSSQVLSYYLDRVHTFLVHDKKLIQLFPSISEELEAILKNIVDNPETLNIGALDDNVKLLSDKILAALHSPLFELSYGYMDPGKNVNKVFYYKKVCMMTETAFEAHKPLRKPSEVKNNIKTELEDRDMVSTSFKIRCLNAVLKFVKDDSELVFQFPDMVTKQAEFVEEMLSQSNQDNDNIGYGFKSLYSSLREAFTIFRLKYDFKLSHVQPNQKDMKRLRFEKIPKVRTPDISMEDIKKELVNIANTDTHKVHITSRQIVPKKTYLQPARTVTMKHEIDMKIPEKLTQTPVIKEVTPAKLTMSVTNTLYNPASVEISNMDSKADTATFECKVRIRSYPRNIGTKIKKKLKLIKDIIDSISEEFMIKTLEDMSNFLYDDAEASIIFDLLGPDENFFALQIPSFCKYFDKYTTLFTKRVRALFQKVKYYLCNVELECDTEDLKGRKQGLWCTKYSKRCSYHRKDKLIKYEDQKNIDNNQKPTNRSKQEALLKSISKPQLQVLTRRQKQLLEMAKTETDKAPGEQLPENVNMDTSLQSSSASRLPKDKRKVLQDLVTPAQSDIGLSEQLSENVKMETSLQSPSASRLPVKSNIGLSEQLPENVKTETSLQSSSASRLPKEKRKLLQDLATPVQSDIGLREQLSENVKTDTSLQSSTPYRLPKDKRKLLQDLAKPVQSDIGLRIMKCMGWEGGALGARGDGIIEPIVPHLNVGRAGIGHVRPTKPSSLSVASLKVLPTLPANIVQYTIQDRVECSGAVIEALFEVITKRDVAGLELMFSTITKSQWVFVKRIVSSLNKRKHMHIKDFPPAVIQDYGKEKIIKWLCEIQREMKLNARTIVTACWTTDNRRIYILKSEDIYVPRETFIKAIVNVDPEIIQEATKNTKDSVKTTHKKDKTITTVADHGETSAPTTDTKEDKPVDRVFILSQILELCQSDMTEKVVSLNAVMKKKLTDNVKAVVQKLNDYTVDGTEYERELMNEILKYKGDARLRLYKDAAKSFTLVKVVSPIQKRLMVANKETNNKTKTNGEAQNENINTKDENDNNITNTSNSSMAIINGSYNESDKREEIEILLSQKLNLSDETNLSVNGTSHVELTDETNINTKELITCNNNKTDKSNADIELTSLRVGTNETENNYTNDGDFDHVEIIIDNENPAEINSDEEDRLLDSDDEQSNTNTANTDVIEKAEEASLEEATYILPIGMEVLKEDVVNKIKVNKNSLKTVIVDTIENGAYGPTKAKRKKLFDDIPDKKCHITSNYKLCIVPKDYPEIVIDDSLARNFQNSIISAIDYTKELPLLYCHGIQNGRLVYSCQNKNSLEFIETLVKQFDGLSIVEKSNAEDKQSYKMAFKINTFIDEDVKNIFVRLELFNAKLKTDRWRIVKKEQYCDFIVIHVELDAISFNYICDSNFVLYAGNDAALFTIIWD